jgi:hypothetical protein
MAAPPGIHDVDDILDDIDQAPETAGKANP